MSITFVRRVLCAAAACALACTASAQTFSNTSPITIRDANVANPFPSTINVSGVVGPIGGISVTLHDLAHNSVGDLIIALRSPEGVLHPLLARCRDGVPVNGDFTFVPAGLAPPFGSLVTEGTYAPGICGNVSFIEAEPIEPLGNLLGRAQANGQWQLLVRDAQPISSGSISGGWSLSFLPAPLPPAPTADSILYQGRIATPEGPVTTEVVATFRLFDGATSGALLSQPIVMRITPQDGVFSVPLQFTNGPLNDPTQPAWLDISVNGVALLPRQRITPAPRAIAASFADAAQSAETATSADLALSAIKALSADTALNVPWSNISDIPTNLADVRWRPGSVANTSWISGNIGVGSLPLPTSRATLTQPTLNPIQWHLEMVNIAASNARGGIRLSDAGSVEISNIATNEFSFFARLNGTGAWTVASDARLKTDIRPATNMLDAALKLRPVYFHWLNEDARNAEHTEDFGLIAQDVRDVLPRLVTGDESKDTLTVNYSQLSVVAIAAIQELKAQHEAELATLRAENDDLRARLESLASQQQQIDDLATRLKTIESQRK